MLGKATLAAMFILAASFFTLVTICPGSPQAPSCVASVPFEAGSLIFVGSIIAFPVLAVASVVQTRRKRRHPPSAGYEPSVAVPDWGPMYVHWVADKLERKGYTAQRNTEVPGLPYKLGFFASRSRRGLFGGAVQCVAAVYRQNADRGEAEDYFNSAADYCISSARKGSGSSLFAKTCVIVTLLVTDVADEGIRNWIRETKPRRHWRAIDFRVLIPTDDRNIYYCRKTPLWGGALYSGLVNSVERVLQMRS